MIFLRIVGLLLTAVTGGLLFIALRAMYRTQLYLQREHGINEPIRLGRERFIIWAWLAIFLVGIALVILSYR